MYEREPKKKKKKKKNLGLQQLYILPNDNTYMGKKQYS